MYSRIIIEDNKNLAAFVLKIKFVVNHDRELTVLLDFIACLISNFTSCDLEYIHKPINIIPIAFRLTAY